MILGSLCFTICVSRRSLQLTLAWFVCVGWVGLLFSVGELNFDLFLTSSNNLTATVESNAATEKKKNQLQKNYVKEMAQSGQEDPLHELAKERKQYGSS